jgi:hypothetical protein
MKLFDTNVENIEFPNISFTSIIHMPSADFQKICRDFNALAEKLWSDNIPYKVQVR